MGERIVKIGWGGVRMWEWKWEKEKELGWESLVNDVRDFDWYGVFERKCSVKKWGVSGMKKLEEK